MAVVCVEECSFPQKCVEDCIVIYVVCLHTHTHTREEPESISKKDKKQQEVACGIP